MGVPDHLLPHDVVVVTPVEVVDAYQNVTYDYTAGDERTVRGWVQQDQRFESHEDGRDPLDERWLLVTNDTAITALDRIRFAHPAGELTFSVDGPTAPLYTPGGLHHLEVRLRRVDG